MNVLLIVVIAAALASLVVWTIQSRISISLVAAIIILAVAATMADDDWRRVSYHGFIHLSIINMIHGLGLPASQPLLAWHDLHYSYGFHIIVAALLRVLPIESSVYFAGLNLISLVAYGMLIDRIAQTLSVDRLYRTICVLLAIFGSTFLVGYPFGQILDQLGWVPFDGRLDPIHKFITINTNQIGLVLFGTVVLCLTRLIQQKNLQRKWPVWLCVSLVAVGYVYPVAWLGCGLAVGAAAVVLLAAGRNDTRKLAAIVLAFTISTIVLIPWFLIITNQNFESTIVLTLTNLERNGAIIFATLFVPGILLYSFRSRVGPAIWDSEKAGPFLVLLLAFLLVVFALLDIVQHSEAKFMVMAQLPLAVIFGFGLRYLSETRKVLSTLLLALVLLPGVGRIEPLLVYGWPAVDHAKADGTVLRPQDPAEAALYRWLREKTPLDAAVMDTWLTAPVFAGRPLFVGLDVRRESGALRFPGEPADRKDGWSNDARTLIVRAFGGGAEVYENRKTLALALLSAHITPLDDDIWRRLKAQTADRRLYIIARDAELTAALAREGRLTRVFGNEAATVFCVYLTARTNH